MPNQHCGIVSYDLASAGKIFDNKVLFAYENLPPELIVALPLACKPSDNVPTFKNGSFIEVALSQRGGTPQRPMSPELAKMSVLFPLRAREVMTGSLNAVPKTGVAIIEATSEGPAGEFYDVASAAQAKAGRRGAAVRTRLRLLLLSPVEAEDLPDRPEIRRHRRQAARVFRRRRARDGLPDRPVAARLVRRQAPVGIEGRRRQHVARVPLDAIRVLDEEHRGHLVRPAAGRRHRAGGRIRPSLPYLPHVPVDTFWDIGHSDGTAVWFMQHVHPEYRFVRFIEGWEELREHRRAHGGARNASGDALPAA